jgi:peptidoglycan/xylan/chitin deacetylase (PgdA/CDA1 family)
MKTLLKNILIPPFASRMVSAVAVSIFGRGIPVFLLHRMASPENGFNGTSAEHLRTCLQYLSDNDYSFISLENLIRSISQNKALPEKAVVFTMDDGYIDQAEIAAPIFLEFDCPLTFFVISDLLDKNLWPWDAQTSWIIDNTEKNELVINFPDEELRVAIKHKSNRHQARELIRNYFKEVEATLLPSLLKQLAAAADITPPSSPPEQFQALSWDKARELEKQGIRFAPHSVSHNILSKLDREAVKHEILDSWQTLNRELDNPLNVFCYPTGRVLDFGPREIKILQENGFLGAVTTTPGYVESEATSERQLYQIPRFELPDNMADFIQYCSWIEHAKHSS